MREKGKARVSSIELRHVSKSYDGKPPVIPDLSLTIPDGSFTVLVGPSGCGKSTTLRMIAGLEDVTSGDLFIDGERVNEVGPSDRDIAMVFQNYALYPTMTVRGNIEFGLINMKVPEDERRRRIDEISRIVGLDGYLDRKPSQLSGGQRQRVALARAMVKKPKVFLMDEPLSNLDAKLRTQMRTELIALHQRLGTTFVYVTHDQTEAMSMATKIVLMRDGVIQQADVPEEVYGHPKNRFAAQFIGTPSMNVFPCAGLVLPEPPAAAVLFGFRPSRAIIAGDAGAPSDSFAFEAKVNIHEVMGSEIIYQAEAPFGILSFKTFNQPLVEVGQAVQLFVEKDSIHYFDDQERRVEA